MDGNGFRPVQGVRELTGMSRRLLGERGTRGQKKGAGGGLECPERVRELLWLALCRAVPQRCAVVV